MNENQQAKELSVNGIVAFMLSLSWISSFFLKDFVSWPFWQKAVYAGGISLLVLIGTILGWKEKRAATSGVNRSLGTAAFVIGTLSIAAGGGIAVIGWLAGMMGRSISLPWQ